MQTKNISILKTNQQLIFLS